MVTWYPENVNEAVTAPALVPFQLDSISTSSESGSIRSYSGVTAVVSTSDADAIVRTTAVDGGVSAQSN